MKYGIAILIIAIVYWVLWINHEAKPKPEPQATLLPTPATHHSVNGVWVDVDELLNPKQEEGE